MPKLAFLTVLSIFAWHSAARASCLDDAVKFADQICGEIAKDGSSNKEEVTGNLEARTKGVLRAIGAGSVSISAGAHREAYEGVIREQLAADRYDARACRQKMQEVARRETCTPKDERTPPKDQHGEVLKPKSSAKPKEIPKYSYLVSAPSLVGKDISLFQQIPKKMVGDKLIGYVDNVTEPIIVNGHDSSINIGIVYFFFKNYLHNIRIYTESGGEDCNSTQLLGVLQSLNLSIWGKTAGSGEANPRSGKEPGWIKSSYYDYYPKKDSKMTLYVNWYSNPSGRYNNSAYICEYENYYSENCGWSPCE